MAFSKSKFLTLLMLFSTLHLAFPNQEPLHVPIAQSDIVGHLLPYAQDCCNFDHTGNCGGGVGVGGGGGGDYNNPPCVQNGGGCVQNGGGCVQNPGNRCCSGSGCQGSSCPWMGACPSCGCVRSNVKVEGQVEADHISSEPIKT